MKLGVRFCNLLGIKSVVKFYSDSFRFDISIVEYLGVYFFTAHGAFSMCGMEWQVLLRLT